MGNDVRDGPEPLSAFNRACWICGTSFKTIGRGRYCSGACRQQAFRDRRAATALRLEERVTPALRHQRELVAHTVYECPSCEARLLGERRCDLFRCRNKSHYADLVFMPRWRARLVLVRRRNAA